MAAIFAELPGIDDKDLDVSISDNAVTIKGEKKTEEEENTGGYYRIERRYGSFQRIVPLPCGVDKDKAEATFKRGVLSIVLPKSKTSQQAVQKITIKQE